MNAQQANELFSGLVSSLQARNLRTVTELKNGTTRVGSADIDAMIEYVAKSEKGIKAGMLKFKYETIEAWVNMQACDHKGSDKFIAVKANIKIARILYAIGAKMVSAIDDYSATIIANMLANDGVIFAKTALVSLSKGIEYHALDQTQVIRSRMNKAESTATTQRSSTREALRVLGLAEVHKGMKEDPTKANEKGRALFDPMFA
jgi:hypothetical protein